MEKMRFVEQILKTTKSMFLSKLSSQNDPDNNLSIESDQQDESDDTTRPIEEKSSKRK